MRMPLSGIASSSRPARTSSRPPQKGRLRGQARHLRGLSGAGSAGVEPKPASAPRAEPASCVVMLSAAPAEPDAEVGQRERPRRGQPGVLTEVVDGDSVSLLAERPGRAGNPGDLRERPGVLADRDIRED